MAKVSFKTDAEIGISSAAAAYARRMIEREKAKKDETVQPAR